jgi:hypothetical protein
VKDQRKRDPVKREEEMERLCEHNGGVMNGRAPYNEALAIETGPASEPRIPMLREEKYHDFGVTAGVLARGP